MSASISTPPVTTSSPTPPAAPRAGSALREFVSRRWPVGLALFVAALSIYDLPSAGVSGRTEQALILLGAVLVYLGSAVIARPTAAWPLFAAVFPVVVIQRVFDVDAVLGLSAGVAALLVLGVVFGRLGTAQRNAEQVTGALAFGLVGTVALFVHPVLSGLLVGGGLVGHAVWDVIHHRRNKVVTRTLAEFCGVLDLTVGVTVLLLTLRG